MPVLSDNEAALEVTLKEVLEDKEKRAEVQASLRRNYNSPVVSITSNIPGKVKYFAETVDLVYWVLEKMRQCIRSANFVLHEERIYHSRTGLNALIAVAGSAHKLKEFGLSIEEEPKYGRLIDIDVFDAGGQQINRVSQRLSERKCYVCDNSAIQCMRSKAHANEEIIMAAGKMMFDFKVQSTKVWTMPVETIGTTALEAMLMEAACAPAPGLVDRFNSGAHQDMNYFTFLKSSSALVPFIFRCAWAGWNHAGTAKGLLPVLRNIGIDGEKAMYQSTHGINTQKGLLFLMGVLSAAAARTVRFKHFDSLREAILQETAQICTGIVERELRILHTAPPRRKLTAGERLFLDYGVTGIRGEIEAGLPVIRTTGLPSLDEAFHAGLSLNDGLLHALIGIMAETQDTTILNRHDIDTLSDVQDAAKSIMAKGGMLTNEGKKEIKKLDAVYAKKRISPGGTADLLAATYFLYCLAERI